MTDFIPVYLFKITLDYLHINIKSKINNYIKHYRNTMTNSAAKKSLAELLAFIITFEH
jgi:hypothetical protein